MRGKVSLDLLVKSRLKRWGQRPPGVKPRPDRESWLRGRPSEDETRISSPFLKIPGSSRLRTLPDGLWLNFGGTFTEPFVDILAIEACSTLQNLLDKRSRFAPSTHSMMCLCPIEWLVAPVTPGDPTPRWRTAGDPGAGDAGAVRPEKRPLQRLRSAPNAPRARVLRADGDADRGKQRGQSGPAGANRPHLGHCQFPVHLKQRQLTMGLAQAMRLPEPQGPDAAYRAVGCAIRCVPLKRSGVSAPGRLCTGAIVVSCD